MSARALALAIALLAASGAGAQSQSPDPTKEAGRINARLSMEYLKRGQLQVAQEKIEKALQQNPHDVNVQLSAGLVYERLLENKKAEKHYRQAVREDAESPEALNALATFLCRNDQQAKGEEMFLKAAANPIYRTPFVAYTNAGVCARSAGRHEQAERYPETYAQLAGVLHERGSDLQARAFVERFLAVAPATPDMLLLGHNIEVALKDTNAAAGFRDRLRKEFPESSQALAAQEVANRNPG